MWELIEEALLEALLDGARLSELSNHYCDGYDATAPWRYFEELRWNEIPLLRIFLDTRLNQITSVETRPEGDLHELLDLDRLTLS